MQFLCLHIFFTKKNARIFSLYTKNRRDKQCIASLSKQRVEERMIAHDYVYDKISHLIWRLKSWIQWGILRRLFCDEVATSTWEM